MATLIKYPSQTKKRNEDFFKRKHNEEINWARWAGWWDTDGCFSLTSQNKKIADLKIKDREPVELFANIFETSLVYNEWKTKTPNGKEYLAKIFKCVLREDKAVWFSKNIARFIKTKRDNIFKLTGHFQIDDTPLTDEEFISYLSTVIDGDGSIDLGYNPTSVVCIPTVYSSNCEYLAILKNEIESRFNVFVNGPYERSIYTTKSGEKVRYKICFSVSSSKSYKKLNHTPIIYLIEKLYDNMTLTRKKNRIKQFLNLYNA